MKRSLLASPWRRGFESLPYELIVEIIEFAGLCHTYNPSELRNTMRTLLKVPGFAHCIKSARPAVRLLADPTTVTGAIPFNIDFRTITKFYFTTNSDPFSTIRAALKQMTSLEHLELSANFSFATLYRYNTDWVARKEIQLPNLTSLSVLDGRQTDNPKRKNRLEPDWSPNNNGRTVLSWVIGTLDAPKLQHVTARLTLQAEECRTTNSVAHAFDFPHVDWPVETLELKEITVKDRLKTDAVLLYDVI